jgi:hypothetical protein
MYVLIYQDVNSRAELETLPHAYARNGTSRRWLRDYISQIISTNDSKLNFKKVNKSRTVGAEKNANFSVVKFRALQTVAKNCLV